MKSIILLTISCLFMVTLKTKCQQTIPAVPSDAEFIFQRAMTEIKSEHVTWIKRTAAAAIKQNLDEAEIRKMTTNYGRGFNLGSMDAELLLSMVMMLLANDAEKDLKELMNTLNELKKEKEKIIQAIGEMEKSKENITRFRFDSLRMIAAQKLTPGASTKPTLIRTNETVQRAKEDSIKRTNIAVTRVTAAEIKQVQDDLKTKMNAADEMSDLNSLKMQMIMDRRSKFISTLSNIMKKISDTQNSIIQNLK